MLRPDIRIRSSKLNMKFHRLAKLDQLVSIGAFLASIATSICLAVVFVGCTSTSAPASLYFMKVNLTGFPAIDSLNLRLARGLDDIDKSSITGSTTDILNGAAGVAEDGINAASSTVQNTASQAQDHVNSLVKQLKSDLPDYYSIGLLGYCKDDKVKHTWCSAPKTSFAFNLSNILGSISSDLEKVVPGITKSTLQGYHKVSKAVIWLYIFGLSSTVFSIFCAARAVFFSGGRKLLVLSCTFSTLLTVLATTGITVIYSLFTSGVNSVLHTFGAHANLGANTLSAAWLSVAFSTASFLTWAIYSFCCCI